MADTLYMNAQEVADQLGISRAYLLRQRHALAREHGMPSPLPAGQLRWHRQSVMDWIAGYGRAKTAAARRSTTVLRIHVERQALEERYAPGAAA